MQSMLKYGAAVCIGVSIGVSGLYLYRKYHKQQVENEVKTGRKRSDWHVGSTEENILEEDINIYAEEYKIDKRLYSDFVALLNGGGGRLIIHNTGYDTKSDNPVNTHALDIFRGKINDKLKSIVGSGNVADIFQSDNNEFINNKGNHITYNVRPTGDIHAVNWNSFSKDDHGKHEDAVRVIIGCLKEPTPTMQPHYEKIFEGEKSRNLSFSHDEKIFEGENNFCEYKGYDEVKTYENLEKKFKDELPKYVSAFCKRPEGGKFLAGIAEIKQTKPTGWVVKGVKLATKEKETLKSCIVDIVSKDMCWLKTEGIELTCTDTKSYFKVNIIDVQGAPESNRCVVEVRVRKFYGVVFTKSFGPDVPTMSQGRRINLRVQEVYKFLLGKDSKYEYDFVIMHGEADTQIRLAEEFKEMVNSITDKTNRAILQRDYDTPGTMATSTISQNKYFERCRYIAIILHEKSDIRRYQQNIALMKTIQESSWRVIPVVHEKLLEMPEEFSVLTPLNFEKTECCKRHIERLLESTC